MGRGKKLVSEQTSQAWLQRLKDESWEAELLVAAVSIYGTLQLFTFVEWVTDLFISFLPTSFYLVAYFVVFSALLAISILSSMFIIHFMLRAYWVGLVGLNSVFSDYNIHDAKQSKIYMEKLIAVLPKLDDSIHKADRLCSVIFSAAFGFLMAYGWMFFSSALLLLLANFLSRFVPNFVLLIPIVIVFLLMLAQMVLGGLCNLKRNRDNEWLQTHYYNMSILVSILSFGPLYKAILQISAIFSSNFKKDKALVKLVLLFVFCGFCLAAVRLLPTNVPYLIHHGAFYNPTKAEPRYYKSESMGESFLVAPQINDNVVRESLIEVFVPVFSSEDNLHKQKCDDLSRLEKPERNERRLAQLACLSKYHEIKINEQTVPFDLIRTDHVETGQNGVLIYVKIDEDLQTGFHRINITKTIFDEPQSWSIPFYYLETP